MRKRDKSFPKKSPCSNHGTESSRSRHAALYTTTSSSKPPACSSMSGAAGAGRFGEAWPSFSCSARCSRSSARRGWPARVPQTPGAGLDWGRPEKGTTGGVQKSTQTTRGGVRPASRLPHIALPHTATHWGQNLMTGRAVGPDCHWIRSEVAGNQCTDTEAHDTYPNNATLSQSED